MKFRRCNQSYFELLSCLKNLPFSTTELQKLKSAKSLSRISWCRVFCVPFFCSLQDEELILRCLLEMPYYGLAATTHYPGNFLPNKRVGLLLCFLRYLHINNQLSVEVYA